MSRGRESLKRGSDRVPPRTRLLIVCEGERTEPGYFEGLRRELRQPLVEIEIIPRAGVPKSVVERAREKKSEAEQLAKQRRDDNLMYDEVWCVFDVDRHPMLREAIQQARDNGLHTAISNPCFELWILLHFQDQRAALSGYDALCGCRKHVPRYAKRVSAEDYALLRASYNEAYGRAKALDEWQHGRGCAGENPSTSVYILTGRLRDLRDERQILWALRARE